MNGHSTGTHEILETIRMVQMENLDIRTVTMGIDLQDCAAEDPRRACDRIYEKITRLAGNLVPVCDGIAQELGLPIVNKRVAVTPMAVVAGPAGDADRFLYAEAMERAAREIGINFIGGFSALVEKGFSQGDELLLEALPRALAETERVCASFNVASTRAGINMTAVRRIAAAIKDAAELSKHNSGIACAKLVVFCNAPQDNPFMAGAFHGVGEAECTLNVGVSGPGVVLAAVRKQPDLDLGALATEIKRTAFKITRAGELVGRIASDRLGVPFGILDLSLAPTPAVGDSVARILEAMGLERAGTHGSTAALAMLNDAVKKGGLMASSYVGGLSGAFIPVSEDEGMIEAVESGCLTLDKLEAMTAVCSVGIDMVAVPGNTPVETIAAIIADECAIGMMNRKTTAVRIIPVPGGTVGEKVEFGGLLGTAPIMAVHRESSADFVNRGGRIPAPVQAYGN